MSSIHRDLSRTGRIIHVIADPGKYVSSPSGGTSTGQADEPGLESECPGSMGLGKGAGYIFLRRLRVDICIRTHYPKLTAG